MAKDGGTIAIGILYNIIVVMCWLLAFLPGYYTDYGIHPYFQSTGGLVSLFGDLFLIPSFILYMVFYCSTEGGTSSAVGFGLGFPGWLFGIIGSLINNNINFWSDTYYTNSVITFFLLIFYILLLIFGSILLARRNRWEILAGVSRVAPTRMPGISPIVPSIGVPGPPCSICNRPTRFITQYNRYYCDSCQKYV